MFKHYVKIAYRSLTRFWFFSLINIGGLAIGLACCFLIGIYVVDELNYDRNYKNADQLYRVSSERNEIQGDNWRNAATLPKVAALLKSDFEQIENSARLFATDGLLSKGELDFYESEIRFVDAEFFDLFTFDWIQGAPDAALNDPFSIVLTDSLAKKYFGDEDPLGQTLEFENTIQLTVTGIIADIPYNTHLSAVAFASLESLGRTRGAQFLDNWNRVSFHTYLRVSSNTDIAQLQNQFPDFLNRHFNPNASRFMGLSIMKVKDIYLHSSHGYELQPAGSMARIMVFSAISLCILVIASINFMNLTIAGASRRSHEVGLRKTVGAKTSEIIKQFFGESVLLTLIAAIVALVIVELALPSFNAFTHKQMQIDLFSDFSILTGHVVAVLLVAVFSGLYPAIYQSSYPPSTIVKGVIKSGHISRYFRNTVVVVQFSIAIVLIAASVIIYSQLKYTENLQQGFSDEQVIILNGSMADGVGAQWQVLKQQLLALNDVENVTASNLVPHHDNGNTFAVWAEGDTQGRNLPFMLVDFDFFRTYDITLLAGRSFSESFQNDAFILPDDQDEVVTGNVILNKSAAALNGWLPEQAINKSFQVYHNGELSQGRVVGVVEDSLFESVRSNVKPMVFLVPTETHWNGTPSFENVSVKIPSGNFQKTLSAIRNVWEEIIPEFPMQFSLLEEDKGKQYQQEQDQGQLVSIFTFISLFIATIGLFALSSFNTQLRNKEIGIRKVMGGSVWSIVLLLTNDFSRLVLISNVIAWPVAYYAMNLWLANFVYRIDLTPLIFIGSGLIALCIAWVTVGGTAAKAASQKPVLALRYE